MEKGHGQADKKLNIEAVKAWEKAVLIHMRLDEERQQNTYCPGIFLLVRTQHACTSVQAEKALGSNLVCVFVYAACSTAQNTPRLHCGENGTIAVHITRMR